MFIKPKQRGVGMVRLSYKPEHLRMVRGLVLEAWGRRCDRAFLLLELLGNLPAGREEWEDAGPINPRAAIMMGAWWLCRELGLSTSRARMVELMVPEEGLPSVRWHLPASKTDTMAIGMGRSLGCCCAELSRAACPVHCLWDHLLFFAGALS